MNEEKYHTHVATLDDGSSLSLVHRHKDAAYSHTHWVCVNSGLSYNQQQYTKVLSAQSWTKPLRGDDESDIHT